MYMDMYGWGIMGEYFSLFVGMKWVRLHSVALASTASAIRIITGHQSVC
jgi:hypothetical protein